MALTTSQVNPKDQSYVIPTPEAAKQISDYEKLYPAVFRPRKSLIRHTGTIEDLSYARPKYTADMKDAKFLQLPLSDRSEKMLIFEHVMAAFDTLANNISEGIVDCDSALERLRSDEKLNELLTTHANPQVLQSWLDYWRSKRQANGGISLLLSLRFEDTGKVGADPYVCFRRRELKQPRKTRRSDAQVMEKIRKIRYDLATFQVMLQAGIKRDKLKKESLLAESQAFEKYWQLRLWNQEFGIERPPTLPSFKALHQQVPVFANQQAVKGQSEANKSSSTSRSRPRPKTIDDISDGEDSGFDADLVKISLPPAAIRNVQYSRPYYPFEVVKQIQADIENLLNSTDPQMIDYTAELPTMAQSKRLINTDLKGRAELMAARYAGKDVLVLRKSRCGRLVQSKFVSEPAPSPVLDRSIPLRQRMFYPSAIHHLRSIQARDCAHLNNAFVGNYNQHYIQCTANLATPTSLPAWIAATSELLQASNNKKSSAQANKDTGSQTSPKKKRPGDEASDDASKRVKTESVVSDLTSSPQFTVKVKSKAGSNDSIDANVLNISSTMLPPVTPQESKKAANTSRFTPTGLTKEREKRM